MVVTHTVEHVSMPKALGSSLWPPPPEVRESFASCNTDTGVTLSFPFSSLLSVYLSLSLSLSIKMKGKNGFLDQRMCVGTELQGYPRGEYEEK